ncbi:hypothetical protein [Nocardioides sp. URHA0032]|uniref:hypothetical protein n=1 Tax=Nocardioides sp. URHA0032 TaxID=1380388 RepID=UPI0009DDFF51|nr:hypothetical protein [Nocardioides sp. URHA0032]
MADHRHKRDTNARRKPRAALVAGSLAVLATASAVTVGVLSASPESTLLAQDTSADLAGVSHARETVSRSGSRLEEAQQLRLKPSVLTQRAVAGADEKLWTTTLLNLWSDAGDDATEVGELEAGKHVLVTGRKTADRVEIVWQGESRWVTAGYLSEDKPAAATATATATAAGSLSMAPCPDSSVENGLTSNAVYVYRSVCHAFPQITSYGGWDAHGEHASGKALDIMTSDKALGDTIAAYLQSHASELHLYDVIWWDQIWTPVRASEGWRAYGDHGSPTANHMDHVHVSTY